MLRVLEVNVESIRGHTAKITWTTSEPATSKVNYGEQLAANLYPHETPVNKTLAFEHVIELADLKPETTYQFKVMSKNRAGEVTTSDNRTFTTLAAEESERTDGSETEGFAALLSPTPREEAPRLNPYADVLGSYAGPTPSPTNDYPYYPNYPGRLSSQPLTVVYPPLYQLPQQQTQPQVLAQQTTPAPTASPLVGFQEKIESPPVENPGYRADYNTPLFVLTGIIIGIVLAGVYWRLGQSETTTVAADEQPAEKPPKVYEFSVGG